MIIGESSKCSAKVYSQAKQLAKEAHEIADDLFKGTVDRHRIAVLIKGYVKLCAELRE